LTFIENLCTIIYYINGNYAYISAVYRTLFGEVPLAIAAVLEFCLSQSDHHHFRCPLHQQCQIPHLHTRARIPHHLCHLHQHLLKV
jgi:hypothetical protein